MSKKDYDEIEHVHRKLEKLEQRQDTLTDLLSVIQSDIRELKHPHKKDSWHYNFYKPRHHRPQYTNTWYHHGYEDRLKSIETKLDAILDEFKSAQDD